MHTILGELTQVFSALDDIRGSIKGGDARLSVDSLGSDHNPQNWSGIGVIFLFRPFNRHPANLVDRRIGHIESSICFLECIENLK
jgi:hypothetical protein